MKTNDSPHDTSRDSFHRVRRLRVTGGFLIGLDLIFLGTLIVIIGGRGSGKSTILELIRFALNKWPGREGDPLRKRIDSLIEKNLDGGRVELEFETKNGRIYTISRAAGEEPVLLDEDRKPLAANPAASQLFQADIYSQNELETIAETPHYQLDLLDKFEREALQALGRQINETVRQLDANAAATLPLITKKNEIEGELLELDGIQERLKGLAGHAGGRSEEIERAHVQKTLRDREVRSLDSAEEALQEFAGDLRGLLGTCDVDAKTLFLGDLRSAPNKAILSDLFSELRTGIKSAESALKKAGETVRQLSEAVRSAKRNLHSRQLEQEIEFRKLMEKNQQDQAQAAERTKLERRYSDLLFKRSRLSDVKAEIARLAEQRIHLLDRLMAERQKRFTIRDGIAKNLNEHLLPEVRVTFTQSADTEAFRKWLENNLRNAGIYNIVVAGVLCETLEPRQLAGFVRQNDAKGMSVEGGINPHRATSVIRALCTPEKLMELEVIEKGDLPRIELNDNGTYKSSDNLSTGQKCTVILPILLFRSEDPIFVDQPEDNLDNSYIYVSVVPVLLQAKLSRQMVFITHNANIPVNGEADCIVVMESDGHTARVKKMGTIDECLEDILKLLEGSEEAFLRRGDHYHMHLNEATLANH